jgi:uncharacterized protein with HEPN domain
MSSMLEADRLRLADIGQRIDLILSWVGDLDEAAFMADLRTRDAAALNIQLIGETARRVSEEVKAKAPSIPWQAIVALRNRIAHGYETVDHLLVWRIVQDDLPALRATVEQLLLQ